MHDAFRWRQHAALFLKVNAVTAGCQTLDFADDAVIPPILQTEMTGVDKRQHAVVVHCAAGKTAIPVIFITGCQRNRLMLPVQHVRTGGMSPVHRPLMFTCRMVLKECVIATAEINKPVRIIHPSGRWSQMKNRVPGITTTGAECIKCNLCRGKTLFHKRTSVCAVAVSADGAAVLRVLLRVKADNTVTARTIPPRTR